MHDRQEIRNFLYGAFRPSHPIVELGTNATQNRSFCVQIDTVNSGINLGGVVSG
jgi:hypothetical protein